MSSQPPATELHWLITSYVHSWTPPNLDIFLITDILAHLQLLWTDTPPRLHLHAEDTRGLDKMADPKYCFVEWQSIDQLEPGNTLEHTFLFPSWVECQTRYFTFEATISGLPGISNTGIFSVHAFDTEPPFIWKHTDLTNKEVAGVIDHAGNSITASKIKQNQDLSTKGFRAAWVRNRALLFKTMYVFYGTLYPGQMRFGSVELGPDPFHFPLSLMGIPTGADGSFLIAGASRLANGKAVLGFKNIGTAPIGDLNVYAYEVRTHYG